MLQPSSSGVMHAYVKGRARDGTGTAVPARARLHTRNARTGMHGMGCACRCLRELLALRRSAASTRPALVVDCGIFRKLPCLQTRYIVARAADASLGARIDPAQPLASVRPKGRRPEFYSDVFNLLTIYKGQKPGFLTSKWVWAESRIHVNNIKASIIRVSAFHHATADVAVRAAIPRHEGRKPRAESRARGPNPGFLPNRTLAMSRTSHEPGPLHLRTVDPIGSLL